MQKRALCFAISVASGEPPLRFAIWTLKEANTAGSLLSVSLLFIRSAEMNSIHS
jgi:hypothetical protein